MQGWTRRNGRPTDGVRTASRDDAGTSGMSKPRMAQSAPHCTLREISMESREAPHRTLRQAWPSSSKKQGSRKDPRTFVDCTSSDDMPMVGRIVQMQRAGRRRRPRFFPAVGIGQAYVRSLMAGEIHVVAAERAGDANDDRTVQIPAQFGRSVSLEERVGGERSMRIPPQGTLEATLLRGRRHWTRCQNRQGPAVV